MLDAFEVNIVGSVLGVLQRLWHVTAGQASLIVSVWLLGIMVGALFFGYLADRFGRRRLFILTLLVYSAFTVVSALSPGYYAFLAFRFLTAIGVGAEYSAVNAAITELIPARYRGRAAAAVMNFWPFGSILAGVVTLYFVNALPPSIGWRFAFALGAIIALFSVWARKTLPESPRWLAGRGELGTAESVAQAIVNGDQAFDHRRAAALRRQEPQSRKFIAELADLVRREPGRLALGCLLDFSEAAGYYGLFTLLPLVVLPSLHVSDQVVPWFFIIGNVGAAAGGVVAAISLDKAGRKLTVTGFYVLAAAAMIALDRATGFGSSAVMLAFAIANFFATGGWIAAYPTFSELFPTQRRATGIGFSVAFGRIGAMVAPPLLVALAQHVSMNVAFDVLGGFWLVGVVAMIPWSIWGIDGRQRALEALASE